jgi:hypothetical protein
LGSVRRRRPSPPQGVDVLIEGILIDDGTRWIADDAGQQRDVVATELALRGRVVGLGGAGFGNTTGLDR